MAESGLSRMAEVDAAGQRRHSRRRRSSSRDKAQSEPWRPPTWKQGLAALVITVVGVGVIYEAQRIFRAETVAVGARYRVGKWISSIREPYSAQELEQARLDIERAMAITPENASLISDLADWYVVASDQDGVDEDRRRQLLQQAVAQYRAALALRPVDPAPWAGLASAYHGLNDLPNMQAAWKEAYRIGPNEGYVQPVLMHLVLANWDNGATPEMQDWAKTLYDSSGPGPRKAINKLAAKYGLSFATAEELAEAQAEAAPASGAKLR